MSLFYNGLDEMIDGGPDIESAYNIHYITTDDQNRVVDGWSDGPHPERDPAGAVCINDQGGYQFRLFPGGEENPVLYTEDSIPLYRWDGDRVQRRTEEEIAADRALLPIPKPVKRPEERLDALEAAIERGLSL